MALKSKVPDYMRLRNMKPIDLSKQIKVAPDTAARISRGETNLTLSTVVKLMRLFGVNRIDDLVEFTPDEH